MSRDQATELELTRFGEAPDDLRGSLGLQSPSVRVIVLHVRVLFHLLRVLGVLFGRRQYELVIELSVVPQHEADLLALAHLDPVRNEHHLAVTFAHGDQDGTGRLLPIARLSGGECPEVLVCVTENRQVDSDYERCRSKQCCGCYKDITSVHDSLTLYQCCSEWPPRGLTAFISISGIFLPGIILCPPCRSALGVAPCNS